MPGQSDTISSLQVQKSKNQKLSGCADLYLVSLVEIENSPFRINGDRKIKMSTDGRKDWRSDIPGHL